MERIPDSFETPVDAGRIARPDFVRIECLDDFRDQIRPRAGIGFFDHGDTIVCRYTYAVPDTFQTAFDLETRGLIFDKATGRLLSRPLHKFFNMGEREGLDDIDFHQGWRIDEKLDGSMIASFVKDGDVVFHTRGGVSSQAQRARTTAAKGHLDLAREASKMCATPVFEWTSPDNRVIIPYNDSTLTLLALRDIVSGDYIDGAELAARHGVSLANHLVPRISTREDFIAFYEDMVARTDVEGAVMVAPDGHRLKLKASDYLRRHKILANLGNERYAYQAWVDEVIDDTAAALAPDHAARLRAFEAGIERRIEEIDQDISSFIAKAMSSAGKDRKALAGMIRSEKSGSIQSLAFSAIDEGSMREPIRQLVLKRISDPKKRAAIKKELGLPDWTPLDQGAD